jgi:hypothetical protein
MGRHERGRERERVGKGREDCGEGGVRDWVEGGGASGGKRNAPILA